jgi:4-oxalocrotonate tautomerase
MPHVLITMLKGRTAEQKRRMAERITDAIVEEGKVGRDRVNVCFVEVEGDSYSRAGVMLSESMNVPKG